VQTGDSTASRAFSGQGQFVTTHWSVVLAAQEMDSPPARAALEKLCQTYWYPLYAFARRKNYDPEDAKDLTQEYFARLLGKNYLESVGPQRGKFRTFLLTSFSHFLANEWDRTQTQKRGGGCIHISLNDDSGEDRYRAEPITDLSPEKLFDRHWAVALLEQTLKLLESEAVAAGKGSLFQALRNLITERGEAGDYAALAKQFGMSEGSLRVAAHRLRQRYRELLLAEIANTVSNPQEADEELRQLMSAFA
jgi:RNA polymerase sigma factor (sigma-70 family)